LKLPRKSLGLIWAKPRRGCRIATIQLCPNVPDWCPFLLGQERGQQTLEHLTFLPKQQPPHLLPRNQWRGRTRTVVRTDRINTNNRQGVGQGSMAGRREFQLAHYGFNPGYAGRAPYTGHGGGRYGARTVVALSAAVVEVQALTSRGQHR
jgi:hypothetical protein